MVVLGLSARPAEARSTSAAQRLADTFAPFVMMRTEGEDVCDSSVEQFGPPSPVSIVLGNPAVRLIRKAGGSTHVIKRGPTAADIAGRGEDYYLDLPGDPLDPGCQYARDFAALRRAGRAPAVTYAHIAREPGHRGLALQYWFFYYFNQFNDLHEGDWEGMQLAFHATSPAQALGQTPFEIVVFQHAGGEHAHWNDRKVEHDGTHPVVYSAAGSHATFYGSSIYLGNGDNGSGVGCDNTSAPLTEFKPRAILLPGVPQRSGEFAWLTYTGHWGQREPGFNDGPTGPNTKTVWRQPFTFMNGTRDGSARLPTPSALGPSVSNVFCGVVKQVSNFLNFKDRSTPGAIGVALILILIVVVPPCLTRWRPAGLEPLRQARAVGQLLLAAGRLYGRYFGSLTLIAVVTLVLVTIVDNVAYLVLDALGSRSGPGAADSAQRLVIGASSQFGRLLILPLGSAAVIAFVHRIERGQRVSFLTAWRDVLTRAWRLLAVGWLSTILVTLLALTIIGIPYALRKYVDWQLAQQEILFENRSIRDALRGSSRVVHGHWWHTWAVAFLFWLLIQLLPLIGGFVLIFTNVPTDTVDALGAILFGLLIPYEAVGRTLLYLDLLARKATEQPSPATSRTQRWASRLRLRPRTQASGAMQ
jgi:hypothetical protein